MILDLTLTLVLGVGQTFYHQDFDRNIPGKVQLDLQLAKTFDDRASLHITTEHISDMSNGHDWGDNITFVELRVKVF